MHRIVLVVALCFINELSFCQSQFRNGLFFELGGNAGLYSINYERQFSKGLISRIGVAYFYSTVGIPLTIGKVFGHGKHHLEFDGGVTYTNYHQTINNVIVSRKNNLLATGFIGYRYQKPDKRFFFRGGVMLFWFAYTDDTLNERVGEFLPWLGLSAGYRF